MSKKLAELISDLKEQEALDLVRKQLEEEANPMDILADAREGMKIVGERFAGETYFIPDLIYSGEILKGVTDLVEPHIKKERETAHLGKVIIGTVAGDIHDIGKDLVTFMLDVSGFQVLDLGIDVPVQRFVDAIRDTGAKVVGLSGFLTLAFDSMKETIDAIKDAGLRDDVRIMIGGGQVDETVREFTGADSFGKDAMEAVRLAQEWIGG